MSLQDRIDRVSRSASEPGQTENTSRPEIHLYPPPRQERGRVTPYNPFINLREGSVSEADEIQRFRDTIARAEGTNGRIDFEDRILLWHLKLIDSVEQFDKLGRGRLPTPPIHDAEEAELDFNTMGIKAASQSHTPEEYMGLLLEEVKRYEQAHPLNEENIKSFERDLLVDANYPENFRDEFIKLKKATEKIKVALGVIHPAPRNPRENYEVVPPSPHETFSEGKVSFTEGIHHIANEAEAKDVNQKVSRLRQRMDKDPVARRINGLLAQSQMSLADQLSLMGLRVEQGHRELFALIVSNQAFLLLAGISAVENQYTLTAGILATEFTFTALDAVLTRFWKRPIAGPIVGKFVGLISRFMIGSRPLPEKPDEKLHPSPPVEAFRPQSRERPARNVQSPVTRGGVEQSVATPPEATDDTSQIPPELRGVSDFYK